MKTIEVTCPTCKKKFSYYTSDFRPFCSERCRLIDLGQWLSESYTVPVEKLTPEEEETLEHLINEKNENGTEDNSAE
jgi:endogenous inhibitor of DNA gyrase (YacG/DUF329 family)